MSKRSIILVTILSLVFVGLNVFLSVRLFSNQTLTNSRSLSGTSESSPDVLGIQVKLNDIKMMPIEGDDVKSDNQVPTKTFEPTTTISLPVLMYHHINNLDWIPSSDAIGIGLRVNPDIFELQLKEIQARKFTTVTSQDIYDYTQGFKKLPDNPIMVTVGDCYKDAYTKALPLLKKYNMKADFAIITGLIGQNDYMTWGDVKELKKEGMDISSHTVHHCYLAVKQKDTKTGFASSPISNTPNQECPKFNNGGVLNTAEIKGELENSKKELEKQIGGKIYTIVYPFGNYNEQVEEIAKNLDYKFGFTVKPQDSKHTVNFDSPFDIPRNRINGQQKGELIGFFEKKK